jgi:hypothetical protein
MKASESLQNDQSSATEDEVRRACFALRLQSRRSLKSTSIAQQQLVSTASNALAEKSQIF